jgi:hypothetical protein
MPFSEQKIFGKCPFSELCITHCVKYQTLEGPVGLILHCTPYVYGRRGDGYIL